MTERRENEKTVVQEVDRADLAHVDGGVSPPIDGNIPICPPWFPGHPPAPNPWLVK